MGAFTHFWMKNGEKTPARTWLADRAEGLDARLQAKGDASLHRSTLP
jgi:hypothetical protein